MATLSLRYSGLPPARAFPFPATTAAIANLVHGGGLLMGWAVEETTGGAAARLVIGDGHTAGVNLELLPITLTTGESTRGFPPNGGVIFEQGLVVQVTAGTAAGVLFAVLLSPTELRSLQVIETQPEP